MPVGLAGQAGRAFPVTAGEPGLGQGLTAAEPCKSTAAQREKGRETDRERDALHLETGGPGGRGLGLQIRRL